MINVVPELSLVAGVDGACCVGYNITYKAVNICYNLIKFTPK